MILMLSALSPVSCLTMSVMRAMSSVWSPSSPGRNDHAHAVFGHEDDAVLIALGRDHVFDLCFAERIGCERFDALCRLACGLGVHVLVFARLFQKRQRAVARLLARQAGRGKVVLPLRVCRNLGGVAIRGSQARTGLRPLWACRPFRRTFHSERLPRRQRPGSCRPLQFRFHNCFIAVSSLRFA